MIKGNKVESNSTLNKLTNTKKSMVSYVQKNNYNPSDNIINSSKDNISKNGKSMVSKIMAKSLNNNSANSNKENSLFSKKFEKEGYDNPKEMVSYVQKNNYNPSDNIINSSKDNISKNGKSMVSKIMAKSLNNNSANSNKENSLFSKKFEKEGYDNPKEMVSYVQKNNYNPSDNIINSSKDNISKNGKSMVSKIMAKSLNNNSADSNKENSLFSKKFEKEGYDNPKEMVSYVQKNNYNPSDNIINSSKDNISKNGKSMVSKIMAKSLNNNSADSNKENSLFSKTFEKEGYDNPKEMVTFNNLNQAVKDNSLNSKNNASNTIKSINNIPASVLEAEQNNYFGYHNGKLYYKGIPFINCQITIINCTVTEGEKDYYTCSILRKGKLIEKNVYTSSFLKGNWVLGIPGISILCDKNKFEKWLYLYLNSLANQFDINNTVYVKTLPGWYKDRNGYFYLTKSGIVGQTISNTYSKYGQDIPLSLSSQDNSFLKYLKMVNLTRNSPTATIVILYTTMSFCHAILKEANQTPKFTLFLYGNRGSFKTSVALALSQINNNEVEYNLKSTTAGLEAGFREYKDAVMLVDDLAPTALGTDSAKLKSNLETIVRTFGDSTGIKRNNDYAKNGNQIMQYKTSGGAIITGEYITGCESSLARSLYLEVKKKDVDINLLTELQESSIFTNYIVSFILMLTDQLNSDWNFIKNISKEIKAYQNEFINVYSNSRYAEYHGQLSSIANLILYFGTKYNLISHCEAEYFDGIFKKAISDVISQNSNSLKELSPLNILCDSLINSIESGEQKPNHLNDQGIYNSSHILEDDDFYYITSNSFLSIFKRYIKDNDIHTPDMSVTLIGRLLADNNIIKVFQEGNTVRKAKKIPMHGNTRYFHICKKELYKNSSLES